MFFRIRCRIRRIRVEGSRIRKEKVADSKIYGYVWTGPKNTASAMGTTLTNDGLMSRTMAMYVRYNCTLVHFFRSTHQIRSAEYPLCGLRSSWLGI